MNKELMMVSGQTIGERAAWMRGKYGLMVHYILPKLWGRDGLHFDDPEKTVEAFDVDAFMTDFAATKAEWLIFTIGQNNGNYCSPNATIDLLAGPGHCTRRDLLLELATAVKKSGKRFIAYLPCEVVGNTTMHEAFGWELQDGSRQEVFQQRYIEVIREWSARLGDLLDGWWLDGFFDWPMFRNEVYRWDLWLDALRAGNSDAVITFNDGCFCGSLTKPTCEYADYLAGEAEALVDGELRLGREGACRTHLPESAIVNENGCLWHALLPIDAFWALGGAPGDYLPKEHRYGPVADVNNPGLIPPPVFPDAELRNFLHHSCGVGGAVTLNVGIYLDGTLGRASVDQIRRIGKMERKITRRTVMPNIGSMMAVKPKSKVFS